MIIIPVLFIAPVMLSSARLCLVVRRATVVFSTKIMIHMQSLVLLAIVHKQEIASGCEPQVLHTTLLGAPINCVVLLIIFLI